MLHLEGNLREYVGRQLGGVPFAACASREFAAKGFAVVELAARIEEVVPLIPSVIGQLSDAQMQTPFPENPLASTVSTQQFLIHLYGHLSYHLGQIDYLRRILTLGGAVEYARL